MASGITMFLSVLFAIFALYPEAPALGYGGLIVGVGGVLAAARGYWASSTRKVRERMSVVMDAIGHTLTQPVARTSAPGLVGDGSPAKKFEPSEVADMSVATPE